MQQSAVFNTGSYVLILHQSGRIILWIDANQTGRFPRIRWTVSWSLAIRMLLVTIVQPCHSLLKALIGTCMICSDEIFQQSDLVTSESALDEGGS